MHFGMNITDTESSLQPVDKHKVKTDKLFLTQH